MKQSPNFVQRLYGNGRGRVFQGSPDGQADRNMERTSAVEYSPDERSFYRYPYNLGDSPEHQNFIVIDIFENKGEGLHGEHSQIAPFSSMLGNNSVVKGVAGALGKGKALVPELSAIGTIGTGGGIEIAKLFGANTGGLEKVAGVFGKSAATANLVTSGVGLDALRQLEKAGQQNLDKLGKGEEGFVQEALGIGGALKRANKTICLYMPGGVSTNYEMKYAETDFTKAAQMSTMVQGGIKNLMSMVTNGSIDESTKDAADAIGKQMAMGTVKQISEKLDEIGDKMGLGGDNAKVNLDKLVEAGQHRKAKNPFVLQLFEQVERRTFDYEFEFIPRSRREVNEVYAIIRTLKRYSFPSRALGGRMLDFPAEFRITYVNMDKENLYLYRMARCAMTGIDLSYGTNPFTTFKPDDGGAAPTKITMKLKFSELEILTQQRIDQGF